MDVPTFVPKELDALGLDVPPPVIDRLGQFLAMLLDANTRVNLTAIREPDAAWRRLIIDSLTLLPWLAQLEPGATLIDVGSGGGLPGLPVAIARPDLKVTLLEATGKKVRFHEQAIEQLGLTHARSIQQRAETLGQDPAHRQHYDVAVSRAIGPLPEVLEYSLPLLSVGGMMLAMKGPRVEQELDASADALATLGAGELQVFDAYPPAFDNDLVVVAVEKASATPKAYPRLPGVPRKEPL